MYFQVLLLLILVSTTAFSQGRKPSVEDFVGVEVEDSKVAPSGSESLFNLEKDIKLIQNNNYNKNDQAKIQAPSTQDQWSPTVLGGIFLALGLPVAVLYLIMSQLKRKAFQESASNLEVLEEYRRKRELQEKEKVKKVS